MRIVIGSDHTGFPIEEGLLAYVCQLGHQVMDVDTHDTEAVDYPDYAEALSKALLGGQAERGVLIGGSGVGASVAANKVPGFRDARGEKRMFHTRGKRALGLALLYAGLMGGVPCLGGELYIYPNKGQSAEQQSRDRYDCHTWAVQQTGIDPTRAQAGTPTPPPPRGGVFRGAARGAAAGAIGGAIAGDAGEGAAIGAATGGVIGGMKQRGQARSQQQAQANQAAQQQSAYAAYDRALSACLSGRGYTVK